MTALAALATTAVILSKADQINQVLAFQKSGSQDALESLIKSNIRLAMKIAREHKRASVDYEDLVLEAIEGIITAAKKFDASKGASFSTYAAQWMRAQIQAYVQNNCSTVRVGTRTARKLFSSLPRVRRKFGIDVDAAKIASELDLDVKEVEEVLPVLGRRATSLDAPINSEGGTVATLIPDENVNQEEKLHRTRVIEKIGESLKKFSESLKERDRVIFAGRIAPEVFGQDPISAVELAEKFDVSKQRVSQIEKALKEKLRSHFIATFGDKNIKDML